MAEEVVKIVSTPENPAHRMSSGYVGPQVGKALAQSGIYALPFVVIGFLAYISFRFEWTFAVSAILSTMHDVVVVAASFAITGPELALPVLAAIMGGPEDLREGNAR